MFECLIFEERGVVLGDIDHIYPETKVAREVHFLEEVPDITNANDRVMELAKLHHDSWGHEGEDRDYYQKESPVYNNDIYITTSLLPGYGYSDVHRYTYYRYCWILKNASQNSMVRKVLKEPSPALETSPLMKGGESDEHQTTD